MKPSLRNALADSHVAAIAIALLLLYSIAALSKLPLPWLASAADFLATAIAILGVPYFSTTLSTYDRIMLIGKISPVTTAVLGFSTAWLLSRWVYGAGPFRSLRRDYRLLAGRIRA